MNRTITHRQLHDALAAIEATGDAQIVAVPKNCSALYFQKYAHTLAARNFQMRIATRAARGPRAVHMMITEREA
jgi:hypothetical protein